jgi:hypothetical protein
MQVMYIDIQNGQLIPVLKNITLADSVMDAEKAIEGFKTLSDGVKRSMEDNDEICGECGENVKDPHHISCPLYTCSRGFNGLYDGLD